MTAKQTMKAVGLYRYLPVTDERSLEDLQIPLPEATGHDLLVKVEAISVNPVDTKVRAPQDQVEKDPRILGWDAAGLVVAVGEAVTLFRPGDAVYYAGSITRPGCNSQFHLVDERIVGRKPASLQWEEAAALPLTTITAWESLFERLGIDRHGADTGKSLLIIGGAGGVGSMGIQLAKLAGLTVIATASRPETVEWCRTLGADHVIDHRQPLPSQLSAAGFPQVDYIVNYNNTDAYWTVMSEVIAPQGRICSIVENAQPIDLNTLKSKSTTFVWEFMFTRSMYSTPDMARQGELLNEVAALVEAGRLRHASQDVLSPINATNLRQGPRETRKRSHHRQDRPQELGVTDGSPFLSRLDRGCAAPRGRRTPPARC
ncbi:MAG: zinc-binding alcohol dehydrogenase family protein [Chthoniobacter sp.]